IEQSALSSVQTMPVFNWSLSVTLRAVPAPLLETTIVKAAVSPAEIGETSALLRTVTSGQLTVIVTGPTEGLPSLVEVAEAEFDTLGQVAEVVGEVMWTWTDAFPAKSLGP